MRNYLLLIPLLALPLVSLGQVPEDSGDGGGMVAPRAQPAEAQDAEAARERLLKAADQLDLIQSNAETAKVAMEQMKSDIAQLQASNTQLTQQLSALRAAFDKAEAARAKERQALLNEVAQVMAIQTSHPHKSEPSDADLNPPADSHDDTEVHHVKSTASDTATGAAPASKSRKGYYHVVESGETLTMICAAYRADGVKVSVAQVRKANGLTSKSSLKVGQKLFIPRPET